MKTYYYKGRPHTKVGTFNKKYQLIDNGLVLTFYSRQAVINHINNNNL